jgi:multidrug efflux pump
MAQVLVQNRVSLALPVIPALVQNQGISVKKMSPNTLMVVNLISEGSRYDSIYLSNYATIFVKDELGRLPGVAGITYLGQRDYSLRVWLDPDKMANLMLHPLDVITAINQQNVQVAAGQIGQPPTIRAQQFQLTINTQGRLTDPEQFANIIVKSGKIAAGQPAQMTSTAPTTGLAAMTGQATSIVRLRDVARENRFYVRLRFDPERLAKHKITQEQIADALLAPTYSEARRADGTALLVPRPLIVKEDPDSKAAEEVIWLAVYGGPRPPVPQDLARAQLVVGPNKLAITLDDVVSADDGIEELQELDEVGIQLGSQQYDQSCTLNGRPSVALSIYQLPGTNALDVAKQVHRKMKELSQRFPPGLKYKIAYDTTPFVRESVNEVFHTLRDAVILVAIVVLLFLQDWRAMILPMIDVPVSLIGAFAVMALMGFTLNNLTLFGLVLAIGIVVDDAIVVLENIERLIATGLDARSATIKAMEEITGPILAITLVLSAVFIPCCFLGGISGQFFRQFAVTIAVSTIISAINAITMTPSRAVVIFKSEESHEGHEIKREALPWWIFGVAGFATVWLGHEFLDVPLGLDTFNADEELVLPGWLAWSGDLLGPTAASWIVAAMYFLPGMLLGLAIGWFFIGPVNAGLGWFFRAFNRQFDRMTAVYGKTVGRTLRLSMIVMIVYGGLLVLTGWQVATAPTGFIPQQDKGYLILEVQLPDAASVERTEKIMAKIDRIARGETAAEGDPRRPKARRGRRDTKPQPGIPGISQTLGVSGKSLVLNANAPNLGSMYIMLDDFGERPSADEIAQKLLERCQEEVRGATVAVFGGPPVDGLGTTGGFKMIIEDRGNLGLAELQRVSTNIVNRGNSKDTGLKDLKQSSRAETPWLWLDIDRTKCLTMGVSISDVFNTLQVYIGSYYVNNFNEFGRTWQVNVQADQKYRTKVSDLRLLQVRNSKGQMVRLGTLMDVHGEDGPVMVLRYNMYAATAITGTTSPGTSSGDAIQLMKDVAEQELPKNSMGYEWTELTYLQLEAGNKAMIAFLLAVVFVFLVLAAQYESWSLPLAVIMVVPMCLLCSVAGVVILAGWEVNIFTQIGLIVLVGLASKNAILIVEFAKQRREAGVDRFEATLEAARLRLRPILMTSFAFILGVVPLVLASGAGAEMRRSLGLAVFCGMLGVTLFGVFLTPVFFYVIQRFSPVQHSQPHSDSQGTATEG